MGKGKATQVGSPTPTAVRQRLREAAMLTLCALGLFLLISLMSYNSDDPGWSQLTTGGSIHNSGGRVGAWFADVSLYLIGYLAYFFPAILFYSAVHLYLSYQQDSTEWSPWFIVLRLFGCLCTVVAGCGLASLHFYALSQQLPLGGGGVIGTLVGKSLVFQLNLLGTTLLLLTTSLTGLTLATGFSWLGLMDWLGRQLWRIGPITGHFLQVFALGLQGLGQRFADWRKSRAGQRKAINQARPSKIALIRPVKKDELYDKPKALQPVEPPTDIKEAKKKPKKRASNRTVARTASQGDFPALNLLETPTEASQPKQSNKALQQVSELVEIRLADFGVQAEVVGVYPGPVITRFELKLAAGVKVSKITGLAKDLARSLAVVSVRVVEIIPGKPVVGLELPNEHRQVVRLQEVLATQEYADMSSPLALALGKDIAGEPVIVDLGKMPHLLVAGTTGSGKSVGLNGMLLSLLYKAQPEQVRLIMIDPKMLELAVYDDIPHLLTPVVTDMKEAANSLKWCVAEMERRYQLMAALGVRNLAGYNRKVTEATQQNTPIKDPCFDEAKHPEEAPLLEPMPFIVVVVDEFADMIMVVGKKVEELIARIAQKARAAGIHLILATQRPSVDVITGLIKANVPSRIAFQVASRIDSRTILDQMGAEQLLGRGDMLYLPIGAGLPIRVHGAFVDDHEVHAVVEDWKSRCQPDYLEEIVSGSHGQTAGIDSALLMHGESESEEAGDPLYDDAVFVVTESRRASISLVQRKLKIGYNRAARLVEEMEMQGVVSPMQSNGSREVLAPPPVPS